MSRRVGPFPVLPQQPCAGGAPTSNSAEPVLFGPPPLRPQGDLGGVPPPPWAKGRTPSACLGSFHQMAEIGGQPANRLLGGKDGWQVGPVSLCRHHPCGRGPTSFSGAAHAIHADNPSVKLT